MLMSSREDNVPGEIRFGREICGELSLAEQREWWLADGRGGYAGGTIAGSLTRRYHGLLIAPLTDAMDRRHLMMAKADAVLQVKGKEWPLFTNRWYGDVVEPSGYRFIEHFQLLGRMPCWRFACGGGTLEMRIWMPKGAQATYVAYRYIGGVGGTDSATLCVNLLANCRNHHSNKPVSGTTALVTHQEDRIKIEWPEGGVLFLRTTQADLETKQHWHKGFLLSEEVVRGLASIDNHLSIGRLIYHLKENEWVGFAVSTDPDHRFDLKGSMQHFLEQDRQSYNAKEQLLLNTAPGWIRQLLLASENFTIDRMLPSGEEGASIIAGYPWFGDWGRDTMIALPGLTLIPGHQATARSILMSYAKLVDQGQLPNRLISKGEGLEFNTVDAALWYFEAWRAYLEVSHDLDALSEVFPVLEEILKWYRKGTRYDIRMDPQDALLRAGTPGKQLTWMDAKVGNWVVTPRIGKPVEINALWYHAHSVMRDFADQLGLPSQRYTELAAAIGQGFQRFHHTTSGGLYDVLDTPHGNDASIRPNQILAVSLYHTPLDDELCRSVVTLCARELLTSYGLRSLSPREKDYHRHYQGGVADRDGAYHQGTVWAWLLGHYALAEYRVTGDAASAQQRLEPLADHLFDAGLGTISEIFDGDPPHRPKGAPAQAWSVATILEAWWRLEQAKPTL
jgi:4-alpha-glucanotransferase